MSNLNLILESDIAEVAGRFVGHVSHSGSPDESATIREIRVVLRYRTEGRGDTDSKEVSTSKVATDSSGNASEQFELHLPKDCPISYDGRLIRVHWEVKATLDIARRRDEHFTVPVLVVPASGGRLYKKPHPLQS